LLPMISSITEVDEASDYIHRVHSEMLEEGLDIEMPPIGVMIEVPAMAWQVDVIAKRADFVSVGSNDLTQYMLAVDRNNPRVSGLFSTMHPAVLRVMKKIADDVRAAGKRSSVCGEMAGNPAAAVLLMAMGYDVLSMNATNLLKVKSVIRNLDSAHESRFRALRFGNLAWFDWNRADAPRCRRVGTASLGSGLRGRRMLGKWLLCH